MDHFKKKAQIRQKKYRALKKEFYRDQEEVLKLRELDEDKKESFTDKKIPDVKLPDVELLDVELPNIELPDVERPEWISGVNCIDNGNRRSENINFPEVVLEDEDFNRRDHSENILEPSNSVKNDVILELISNDGNEIHQLRSWAIQENIKCCSLDKLLKILKRRLLPNLPTCSKTFLSTESAEYNITPMENSSVDGIPGEFVYLGIESGLSLSVADFHDGDIELIINIDGMPIAQSSGKSFWPILCKIFYIPDVYKPFMVAVYYGEGKPRLSHYLEQFVEELNKLLEQSLFLHDKHFIVKLKCITADTPARSYIKCVKGHGGYGACERCTVPGTSIIKGKSSSVVYLGLNHEARTNNSFRNKVDKDHHMGTSPLEKITPEIDMVTHCVLDFMHLGCCGIMKKLLEMWMYGSLKFRIRPIQKIEISRRLLRLKIQIPSEFQRKPRSLFSIKKWKATELRFFLLYCGPIVLRNVISQNYYRHFILLHSAFRILCSDQLAISLNNDAKKLLSDFVELMPILYGKEVQVINVHNLLHIADDVINFNCSLTRLTCFPFESALCRIKRVLRTAVKPLAQVCRREHERLLELNRNISFPKEFKIINSYTENGTLFVTKLIINYYTCITNKRPDNYVLLKNGQIMEIMSIFKSQSAASEINITGKIWTIQKDLNSFRNELSSINGWRVNSNFIEKKTFRLIDIKQKLIFIRLSMQSGGESQKFALSLLHT